MHNVVDWTKRSMVSAATNCHTAATKVEILEFGFRKRKKKGNTLSG